MVDNTPACQELFGLLGLELLGTLATKQYVPKRGLSSVNSIWLLTFESLGNFESQRRRSGIYLWWTTVISCILKNIYVRYESKGATDELPDSESETNVSA